MICALDRAMAALAAHLRFYGAQDLGVWAEDGRLVAEIDPAIPCTVYLRASQCSAESRRALLRAGVCKSLENCKHPAL
jgi:hypothetical protein